MRTAQYSRKFCKDYKRCQARGLDISKLKAVVGILLADAELPARCRPHKLTGNWAGYWECHIAPDWLLIYRFDDDAQTLDLIRTGTHSDLF